MERTLLAWNRTGVSLMALGFVIERFGLFMQLLQKKEVMAFHRIVSLSIGAVFIGLSTIILFCSIVQYKRALATLSPAEIPAGYNIYAGVITNGIVGLLGLALTLYVLRGVF
ncbi:MAG: DUF202 domain-containing protein [Desulfobacterales bacterium]|nr:DUF202 domain-containing protein [Desulfobacterales bacterium]